MITCKEDLMDTYIINDKGELLDTYLKVCANFGLHCFNDGNTEFYAKFYVDKYVVCNEYSLPSSEGVLQSDIDVSEQGLTELTLSDLKPTRTEYVKVDESIFDLKADFEAGELYTPDGNYGFCSIPSCDEEVFVMKFNDKCIYRKVECEVTWRDEIKRDYALKFNDGKISMKTGAFDVDVFIEMCHKVYHLTK